MNDVMVDLETLGNGPNSVIVAIGAVKFDLSSGKLGEEFYMVVDPESCVAHGLQMDVSTVLWWMGQSETARTVFSEPNKFPLPGVLHEFAAFISKGDVKVWGNGASFDNVILANAYTKCEIDRPWKFWSDHCYRTVKALYPHVKLERIGTHHNALDDAKSQALHLIKIFNEA